MTLRESQAERLKYLSEQKIVNKICEENALLTPTHMPVSLTVSEIIKHMGANTTELFAMHTFLKLMIEERNQIYTSTSTYVLMDISHPPHACYESCPPHIT